MELPTITDEFMLAMRPKARPYTFLLLRRTPQFADPDAFATLWEHGRRNYALREAGLLSIVCPMPDDEELAGIAVFNAGFDEVHELMAEDPAVSAGLLTYTLHPCIGFPGDALSGDR
jgi:hypothetical protein